MVAWHARLRALDPCSEALDWAQQYRTPQAAWDACERGDWMLWVAARTCGKRGSTAHRHVVLAACACAAMALRQVPPAEHRPRRAITLAWRWARNPRAVSVDTLRSAAYAATAVVGNVAQMQGVVAGDRATVMRALAECARRVRRVIPRAPRLTQVKQ